MLVILLTYFYHLFLACCIFRRVDFIYCLSFRSITDLLGLSLLVMSDSLQPHRSQASCHMEFHKVRVHWGLTFPPPGDLTDSGIKPLSSMSHSLQVWFLPQSHQGSFITDLNNPIIPQMHIKVTQYFYAYKIIIPIS